MVAFNQSFYQADENSGLATITVARTAGIGGTGAVNFATTPNTAMPGIDFTPTNGVLTFLPGDVSKTFNVAIIDNNVQDGNRTLTLILSSPSNVTLGIPSRVTLTIVDNESFNEPAGSSDVSFRDPLVDGPIYSIASQRTNSVTDGRLIIAGDFCDGQPCDAKPARPPDDEWDVRCHFRSRQRRQWLHPSDRCATRWPAPHRRLFTKVASTNRNYIARLTLDGKLDALFNPGSGADNPVYALALQADNKILAGGEFSGFNSFIRPHIVRLNTNGAVDLSFNAGTGPNGTVYAVALQGDGKVLVGGDFTQVNGAPFNHLARLNRDGSVDMTFYEPRCRYGRRSAGHPGAARWQIGRRGLVHVDQRDKPELPGSAEFGRGTGFRFYGLGFWRR